MKRLLVAFMSAAICCISIAHAAERNDEGPALRETKVDGRSFAKGPDPIWAVPTPVPETQLTGPVVVRLSEVQLYVDNSQHYYFHKAIQINSASALSELGQMSVDFVPEYQKLTLHTLRVIRNNETLNKLEKSQIRFFQRETGLENSVYAGVITASILIEDLRVGDVLEFAYTSSGSNPVFGNKFFDSVGWAPRHPTELRRVTINYPANRDIHYKFVNSAPGVSFPQPVRTQNGERIRLAFDYQRAPATLLEENLPAGYDAAAWMQFSEYRSWNEVAAWAAGLFRDTAPLTGELARQVSALQKETSTEDKILKALRYVQNDVRYFSVSLGESSHRPAQPNVTIQRRFGDCKDKSLLLISLLKHVGVSAEPVLVSLDRYRNIEGMLPSPSVFNHVVVRVRVDGKAYFLDPTLVNQAGRLETSAQFLIGSEVLLADPKATQFVIIGSTDSLAGMATSILRDKVTLADFEKPATLERTYELAGNHAQLARHLSQRYTEQYNKALLQDLASRYPTARRVGAPTFEDLPHENRFRVVDRFTIDKPAELDSGAWYVGFQPANLIGMLTRPDSLERKAPLELGTIPIRARYSFELIAPENVRATRDPQEKEVANDYFKASINERFRGNVARFEVDLSTSGKPVPPTDLQLYDKDRREANRLIRGFIAIPTNWIDKGVKRSASAPKPLVDRLVEKYEEEIAAYTKVLESGKLTGKDLASVHTDRGVSYSNLGKLDLATADLRQAIKLDPANGDIRHEIAVVHEKLGEYQTALEQLNKALALGDKPEHIYRQRAQVYYFQGKYGEALHELERLLQGTADPGRKVYAKLWYMWTLAAAGKPTPDKVKAEIVKEADGAWPRPALALFTGDRTPEQILGSVEALAGDERVMNLCEAYFYIGEYYLSKKDLAKAKEYFEKTLATGVFFYTEYWAAKVELERLKGK